MSKTIKVNGEEFEVEDDSHPTVEHFKQSISEIELGKKLARYYELTTEITALEAAKDALRAELLELGKGERSVMGGGYAAFYTKVSGRVSTDWKQAYKDAVGEMTSDDVSKYVRRGEDTIKVEVRRLG